MGCGVPDRDGRSPGSTLVRRTKSTPEFGRSDGEGRKMHTVKMSRRDWMAGAATLALAAGSPLRRPKKIRDFGGAETWDVPVTIDGTITDPFMEQLAALGKAFPRTASSAWCRVPKVRCRLRYSNRTELVQTPVAAGVCCAGCAAVCGAGANGSVKWKLAPLPSSLSAQMRPP